LSRCRNLSPPAGAEGAGNRGLRLRPGIPCYRVTVDIFPYLYRELFTAVHVLRGHLHSPMARRKPRRSDELNEAWRVRSALLRVAVFSVHSFVICSLNGIKGIFQWRVTHNFNRYVQRLCFHVKQNSIIKTKLLRHHSDHSLLACCAFAVSHFLIVHQIYVCCLSGLSGQH